MRAIATSISSTLSRSSEARSFFWSRWMSEATLEPSSSSYSRFEANKYAVYAHLGSYVSDKTVKAGDVVGFIGMTGWTLGCHLHFAIWQGALDDMLKGNGKNWQDPKKYFPNAYQRPAALN